MNRRRVAATVALLALVSALGPSGEEPRRAPEGDGSPVLPATGDVAEPRGPGTPAVAPGRSVPGAGAPNRGASGSRTAHGGGVGFGLGGTGVGTAPPEADDEAPGQMRRTVTTLTVAPRAGDAHQNVAFTATVTSAAASPSGTMTFRDGMTVLGSVPVSNGTVLAFATNALGAGRHVVTAEFTGAPPYLGSVSPPVTADYGTGEGGGPREGGDEQPVIVTIPPGTLSVVTPYTAEHPLDLGTALLDPATSTYAARAPFEDIAISDTRRSQAGFVVTVRASEFRGVGGARLPGSHAGLSELVVTEVVGTLHAADLVVTNNRPNVDEHGGVGLGDSKELVRCLPGRGIGTVRLDGVLGVAGIPTSMPSGGYRATVTFTVL